VLSYTGHSPHTLLATDLGEMVDNLQPWLCDLVTPKASIRFHIADRLPNTLVDASEVRQVLRNLVLNAAEATAPQSGSIEIRVDCCELSGSEPHLTVSDHGFRPGPYVCVEVQDSGPGMPPEIAERAFDPFFSTKFVGRGLGLSEVLGIMRAHHGAVRLTTTPLTGTSVQLFFPARELSRKKLLSVDDTAAA
jgi:two-component system, cell cycle sensor histidine kinase and response regulator CckA